MSFRVRNFTSGSSAVALDNMSITRTDGMFLTDCPTLDVEWLDVNVQCTSGGRRITWTTVSQDDTLDFKVERSADLVSWSLVQEVRTPGNAGQATTYHMLDTTIDFPDAGEIMYYRVVHTAADVEADYSQVVASQCQFRVFPNPADDHILIRVPQAGVMVRVVDATGRIILVHQVNELESRISVAHLASGYYAVQLEHSGVVIAHAVFIKV